jgi:phospholipase C
LKKDIFIESVYNAKFRNVPSNFKSLTKQEIDQINGDGRSSPFMPQQEKGTRSSCALPYELYAEGKLSVDKKTFTIDLKAGRDIFGEKAAGSPFNIYAPGKYGNERVRLWAYAVAPGDLVQDKWVVDNFEKGIYHLRVYGPNGFFREFIGDVNDPVADMTCRYQPGSTDPKQLTGNIEMDIAIPDVSHPLTVRIKDNAFKAGTIEKIIDAKNIRIPIELARNSGWYDFTVTVKGHDLFERRYAGRVETGRHSISDPFMGGVI